MAQTNAPLKNPSNKPARFAQRCLALAAGLKGLTANSQRPDLQNAFWSSFPLFGLYCPKWLFCAMLIS